MKPQHLIFAAFVAAISNLAHGQENCRPIETTDPKSGFPITAQKITRPGEYCLTSDLRAPRTYVFSEGGERTFPNYMLSIAASDVVVDLHGYTLKVDTRGMGGMVSGYWKDLLSHRKITIRNGTLKSRSASAISFNTPDGSIYSDFKAMHNQSQKLAEFYKSQFGISDIAEDELQKLLKTLPQSADAYSKTEYLIDHMKIESGSVLDYVGIHRKAIGMKGASNIIRNSTIEVEDGHAAIYLFGPNQLIENNVIIFKGKAAVVSAAAIKLHQADNTIIRNNDIIIESSEEDAPEAAISLIDSKSVVVEGNRIYGIKTLMHAWDDKSTIIDRNNDFRSMLRRPWPSGEPGVH
jgi:hypothetical protein